MYVGTSEILQIEGTCLCDSQCLLPTNMLCIYRCAIYSENCEFGVNNNTHKGPVQGEYAGSDSGAGDVCVAEE